MLVHLRRPLSLLHLGGDPPDPHGAAGAGTSGVRSTFGRRIKVCSQWGCRPRCGGCEAAECASALGAGFCWALSPLIALIVWSWGCGRTGSDGANQPPSGPPRPIYPAPGHSEGPVPSQPALGCPASPAPGQSESLVPGARWGGPGLCGGAAPVAFPRGRACFWAPALRSCVGCRRGPAQNRSTASSRARKSRISADVAARRRGGYRSRRRRPESLAPHPQQRHASTGPESETHVHWTGVRDSRAPERSVNPRWLE
ncbi:hypothetical protein LV75_006579 [Actinokineospora diospyrosa]|uniref:Uncharacterized protein n=1 Tax=Actinokineospora diospyrosa TaxID=103728 RepID=A0ABT1IN05_9PSEU|nr:hypothetical protein [Actinokineospora diospyrosa]